MEDLTQTFTNFSESFPTDIRTASVGIVHCLEVMALVVNVKCYPLLTDSIGFHSVVYIYRKSAFDYFGFIIIIFNENVLESYFEVPFFTKMC